MKHHFPSRLIPVFFFLPFFLQGVSNEPPAVEEQIQMFLIPRSTRTHPDSPGAQGHHPDRQHESDPATLPYEMSQHEVT
jgi:hypothetical protein